ncbi:MAG: alpha/beta hydrolase, partial [Bdellovibrionales bacterium]|nr:alpha/beta hydrolase [Bdellovibrionales bacterium]
MSSFFLSGCGFVYEASLKAPEEPEYQQIITTRAHTFRYRRDEPGKPHLVYIHGKLGSTNDIVKSPLLDALKEDFSLFTYDRPGSGHSLTRKGWWSWSPEDFANHLHELLEREGITNPVFLAHSWGGAIALNYALQYPGEVRGMVLLAPAAYPWPGYFSTSVYEWFVSSYLLSDLFLQTVFVPLGKLFGPIAARAVFNPTEVPKDFLENVFPLALQPTAYQKAARDTVELRDELKKQAPRYHEIQTPTIVLSNDDDKVVPARIHGGPLVEALPHGEIRY